MWGPVVISGRKSQFRQWPSALQLLQASYHWATWLFIFVMVVSQFLSIGWDSITRRIPAHFGRDPFSGPYQIVGYNDVPYSDRVIACVQDGDTSSPWLISELFAAGEMTLVDNADARRTGYRIVQRPGTETHTLDTAARKVYSESCKLIQDTIDHIFDACTALGYANLTRDHLRIVYGADSDRLYEIPNSLPILIMPFWDSAPLGRHAIPTWSGDACIFRLDEAYMSSQMAVARFRGVNQTVRQSQTIDWLRIPSGGEWKNGWYEDPSGMRWYSDVVSSYNDTRYRMMHRQFDMRTGQEFDCENTEVCRVTTSLPSPWGPKSFTEDVSADINSVFAANGTQFGVFLYECLVIRTVHSMYDWETFLSNLSVTLLLARWMFSMLSLHMAFYQRTSQWNTGGIGCIASSRSFNLLPLLLIPRLRQSFEAFWTVGCNFEGQQMGLSESWFAIYPAIVEIMLLYYSLLNWFAKVLRRRVSDVLFAPTIIVLCALHYFRQNLANSGWLSGVDGRVATVVFSDEVNRIRLTDFFTSDLALRINGNVKVLFTAKLAIFGVNLLPLLFARSITTIRDHSALRLKGIERALRVCARHVGGLGHPIDYSTAHPSNRPSLGSLVVPLNMAKQPGDTVHPTLMLSGYQLIRLGYVVFGGRYLITFEDWDLMSTMAPLRNVQHLWNHRIVVWKLRDSKDSAGKEVISKFPKLWRLDDRRLLNIPFWEISACDIRC